MRLARLTCIAALLLAGPATAAPSSTMPMAPIRPATIARAQSEALESASRPSSNDAAAMTLLGELYRQGLGIPADQKAATEWYEQAAARGDINATFALALQLLDEKSGKRDPVRAGTLLEKAAAAGHPAANYNLALALLATGRPDEDKRAIASLEIAARAGVGEAMHGSAFWRSRAAAHARERGGRGRLDGRRLPRPSATSLARVEYAIMLFNGIGVIKNEAAAAKLFQRAAAQGNAIAQNRLAKLYQFGLGIRRTGSRPPPGISLPARRGLDDAALDELLRPAEPRAAAPGRAHCRSSRISTTVLTAP